MSEPMEPPTASNEGPLLGAEPQSSAHGIPSELLASSTRDLGGRPGTWRNLVQQRAAALNLALAEVQVKEGSWEANVLEEIRWSIFQAETIATTRSNWVRRIADSWTGFKYEFAMSLLDRASEGLLLVQPSPAVLAQLPNLRASVKARLKATDPRSDLFIRILDDLERRSGLDNSHRSD